MEDQSNFEFEDGEIGQLINQFLSDTVCPHTFIIKRNEDERKEHRRKTPLEIHLRYFLGTSTETQVRKPLLERYFLKASTETQVIKPYIKRYFLETCAETHSSQKAVYGKILS